MSLMKAIVADEAGGPEVLRLGQAETPQAGPGEVLIRVTAAGVNRADALQRAGLYPPPEGTSPVLGLECSGQIAETGAGVTGWAAGQRVCALLAGGGYAQFAVVPAAQLLPADDLTAVQAAALPETYATVWWNVFMRGQLQPGETVLVHGALSGIGTTVMQLAKHHGAKVIGTVGSEARCRKARAMGADVAVSYRDGDFVAATRDASGGRGADVIVDIVGAKYLARNIGALAVGGRLIIIGLQGGRRAELDISALLSRSAAIHATSLRYASAELKGRIIAGLRADVLPLVRSGVVAPVIDSTFDLANAAAAHRRLDSGEHTGKIVLTLGEVG